MAELKDVVAYQFPINCQYAVIARLSAFVGPEQIAMCPRTLQLNEDFPITDLLDRAGYTVVVGLPQLDEEIARALVDRTQLSVYRPGKEPEAHQIKIDKKIKVIVFYEKAIRFAVQLQDASQVDSVVFAHALPIN